MDKLLLAALFAVITILLGVAGVKLMNDLQVSMEQTQILQCLQQPWLDTRPPC